MNKDLLLILWGAFVASAWWAADKFNFHPGAVGPAVISSVVLSMYIACKTADNWQNWK